MLSLKYPADPESQLVFQERVARFFSYSTSNMISLTFGAVLIASILTLKNADQFAVLFLLLVTSFVSLSTFLLAQYVIKHKLEGNRLAMFLHLRVFTGCLIGLMYGIAVFLLPVESAETGLLLLLPVYIVSISIAILQYSVIPSYYALFNISIFLPLFIYLPLNPGKSSLMIFILLASGIFILVSKGLKISRSEINAIKLNFELQKEITEHVVTHNKLQKMALYDNLTKVANRHLFEKSATISLQRSVNNKQSLALLYVDLNDFKAINDRYGHSIGDKVLIETAERIRSRVRSSDLVARLGGDEFVIVLENYNSSKVSVDLLNSITAALNDVIEVDAVPIALNASIGVGIFPEDGATLEELLHAADRKMYTQKTSAIPLRGVSR